MPQKAIWQLALAGKGNICPVCGVHITGREPCTVMITPPDQKRSIAYSCEVLYCTNCDIPFAEERTGRAVFEKTGCWLSTFSTPRKCSTASIKNKMHYRRQRHPVVQSNTHHGSPFELVSNTSIIWKTVQTICSQKDELEFCPKCKCKLHSDYTLVPVTEHQRAKVPGLVCPNCQIIYIKERQELSTIMRDNPLTKGYTLDGHELWNASIREKKEKQEESERLKEAARKKHSREVWAKRKKHLRNTQDSVVMVCIKTHGQIREYVITNQETVPAGCGIYSYKSFEGRELLSAAFAEERDKTGTLFDMDFEVVDVVFTQDHVYGLPDHILPVLLTIKADGGYISSVKNRNYEIVDLLVYSPISQRYELMRGTHDKEERYCFTDISIFRRYIHEHGNPRTSLDFSSAASGKSKHDDLRSESVLMGYGYSVSKANNLSERERHEILAEIVDLGILKVNQIVNLLDFNCRLHSGEQYYWARRKWETDKAFIENYKINPNRFLIADIK